MDNYKWLWMYFLNVHIKNTAEQKKTRFWLKY